MSVEDFFAKDGIKKFKNGVKAFKDKQAVRIAAATMVLSSAFGAFGALGATDFQFSQDHESAQKVYVVHQKDTLCSFNVDTKNSADIARIQQVVDYASKTEQGREVLQNMSKLGTTLNIDHNDGSAIGYFTPSKNSVTMNANCSNAQLCSNIVHEGEHACQQARLTNSMGKISAYKYNVADVITLERAKEADAVATQANHCYQLMQQGFYRLECICSKSPNSC